MGARAMDTVRLYRAVLKSATKFPSKNKMAIVEEIKVEFRQKRELTDAKEIEKAVAMARDDLDRLNAFSNMDSKSNQWQVSLKGPHTGD